MSAQTARSEADFCIEIDFKPGTPEPARIFRTMTGLIEACRFVDKKLVKSINTKLEPLLLLEDIEAASLKAWMRNALESIDDDAIHNLDWKKAVGGYLVKAKYFMIDFIDKRSVISDRIEIEGLRQQLLEAASGTQDQLIPFYAPLTDIDVLESLQALSAPLKNLLSSDHVQYVTRDQKASFNVSFEIIPEQIESLLTKETIDSKRPMILKVKRPDYLGEAMWEFRHGTSPIEAKILDKNWLADFQKRLKDVRPGDALRVEVETIVKYGFDGEVISTHHNILTVLEILTLETPRLLFDS